ncbi:MAG: putative sulfate exporter family transporter [Mucinivorans sp.]
MYFCACSKQAIMVKVFFFGLIIVSFFVSPAIALFIGLAFALVTKNPYPKFSQKASKYLLQISVVGLGFGMNLVQSLASSKDGMIFTIVSVSSVMVFGYFLGRWFGVDKKLTHLISSGTAICGGSAIAAISPVIKANESQTGMSLAVIFTLNAVALFSFPWIGHLLDLTEQQFGMWAAIAIHDTSSVVGAGAAYGPEALVVATTVKLTRALWIIPLAILSSFVFPRAAGEKRKISIPWFILFFVVAMVINTYLPINGKVLDGIAFLSHRSLSVTLFLIGYSLSVSAVRQAGVRPLLLALALWIGISVVSLLTIL